MASVGRQPVDQETQEARKVDPAPAVQSTVRAILSISPLSKIEKIAILLLCFILLLGAALTLIHFSSRIPTRSLIAEKIDFPVSGKIVTITAASTYWRKPITSGDNADVVRRNTQLIPVVKLSLSSKTGAIRVFFRNEEGLLVGDVITRSVAGDSEITVIATAGFDDLGMHTAYRTGSGKRWRAQVFEAHSATASREDFSMVLEMEIDTQIRLFILSANCGLMFPARRLKPLHDSSDPERRLARPSPFLPHRPRAMGALLRGRATPVKSPPYRTRQGNPRHAGHPAPHVFYRISQGRSRLHAAHA